MKIKSGKPSFWLIMMLLMLPLHASAMFSRNSATPQKIHGHSGGFQEVSGNSPADVDISGESAALEDANGRLKKEYLMGVIKKIEWLGFEWTALKEYLFAYMFGSPATFAGKVNKLSEPSEEEDDDASDAMLSADSQQSKVEFLKMTQGTDGAGIINGITKKIMQNSQLKGHEAFFLVFNAILHHLPSAYWSCHPNGTVVRKLAEADLNYQGAPYEAPSFAKTYQVIARDAIDARLINLGLTTDGDILSARLVNSPNVLAQIIVNDARIPQPATTKSATQLTAGTFIAQYPPQDQLMVFIWLAGKRMDYELKPAGGFYQPETSFRQAVYGRMRQLHDTPGLQVSLAILALDAFGYNYLNWTNTATIAAKPACTLVLLSSRRMTNIEAQNFVKNTEVQQNFENIARAAGVSGANIYALKRDHAHSFNEQCVQMMFQIRNQNGSNTLPVLRKALKECQLYDALRKFEEMFCVPAETR